MKHQEAYYLYDYQDIIPSADIKINKQHIDHVAGKHKKELEKLGFTALDFIRVVINGYNEIREAKDGTYFLANVIDESSTYTAIIGLNYNESKKFWEIKNSYSHKNSCYKQEKAYLEKGANPFKDLTLCAFCNAIRLHSKSFSHCKSRKISNTKYKKTKNCQ